VEPERSTSLVVGGCVLLGTKNIWLVPYSITAEHVVLCMLLHHCVMFCAFNTFSTENAHVALEFGHCCNSPANAVATAQ